MRFNRRQADERLFPFISVTQYVKERVLILYRSYIDPISIPYRIFSSTAMLPGKSEAMISMRLPPISSFVEAAIKNYINQ